MAAMDELDQTEEDESSCIRERLQEILDDFHARKERYCLMNGNIPHVALKYDKEARVFSLPYREADITDTLRARTDPEAIRTCLHAGVLPLAYEDKGISIEVQSG
jgi:broad specificity polyphosphatase/5'/3'-nucleotidase SurE